MIYPLRFTETMVGAFSFGERDYRCGFRTGCRSCAPGRPLADPNRGGPLLFRLTISTDDVDAFVADPTHRAAAAGYVQSDRLGGRLPVEAGLFNLFVDEGPRTRHMLYRLYFADGVGRPLTLAGYKDVKPGPLTRVWPETSTLYVRVLDGHVPVTDGGASAVDGIVGSGILHIRPLDFARQLTTFRVSGPSVRGNLRAFDSFGRLFLSELWEVFRPHPAASGGGGPR